MHLLKAIFSPMFYAVAFVTKAESNQRLSNASNLMLIDCELSGHDALIQWVTNVSVSSSWYDSKELVGLQF